MRVVVIGGNGYSGRGVVQDLVGEPGVKIWKGSRRARGERGVRIDLQDPSTFEAVNDFDLIIDCADTTRACPAALAEHCLREGLTLVETTADPEATRRMYERAQGVESPRGTLVLGAGLFPGISNLLARRVSEGIDPLKRLEVGVRISPLSGAGPATCALMADLLGRPARRYAEGSETTGSAAERGPVIAFPEGGRRGTIQVGLPEGVLLNWSTGVPNTGTYVATVPFFLRHNMRLLSRFIPDQGFLRRAALGGARLSLTLLRSLLLRRRATWVELVALANRSDSSPRGVAHGSIRTTDGFGAHAAAVAAVASLIRKGTELSPGIAFVDDVFPLDSIVSEARRLAPPGLELAIVSVP